MVRSVSFAAAEGEGDATPEAKSGTAAATSLSPARLTRTALEFE
jgi:hypothetical protein